MKADKILDKFYKNYDKAKRGKEIQVMNLTRKDFKKQLSQHYGIGFQDLKKQQANVIRELGCKGYKLNMIPVSLDPMDMEINVVVIKEKK